MLGRYDDANASSVWVYPPATRVSNVDLAEGMICKMGSKYGNRDQDDDAFVLSL